MLLHTYAIFIVQRLVKAGKNGLTMAEQKMFLEFMHAIACAIVIARKLKT